MSDPAAEAHDRACFYGRKCPDRPRHIEEAFENSHVVRVDTRDEATVAKVASVIGNHFGSQYFDVRDFIPAAREALAALGGEP